MENLQVKFQDNYSDILKSINFETLLKHPNILVAANFWDKERFQAAKICYGFMRMIDDMIDDYKTLNPVIEENKKEEFLCRINDWYTRINDPEPDNTEYDNLKSVIKEFRIPIWPFNNFAEAMVYDIHHDGFPTLDSFIHYSEGASVAPASIFVHLCGLSDMSEQYGMPAFDVRQAATPCAMFSYLVHIIRDFQKDQNNNLNYFAADLMAKYGISGSDLQRIARGGDIMIGFRQLIREYYLLADSYRIETRKIIREINPLLKPKYQLSIGIIFSLYEMVFERIDVEKGKFTTEELNPSLCEIMSRVSGTIREFKESECVGETI